MNIGVPTNGVLGMGIKSEDAEVNKVVPSKIVITPQRNMITFI